MSNDETLEKSYKNPWIGHGYDALSYCIYAPLGGREELREAALSAVGVTSGQRVLELGCGTGGITRRLLARGAQVTAVDWSGPMLRIARTRAPGASFAQSEITSYETPEKFDLVLFAFVLHELSSEARFKALSLARAALAPEGKVAVVDHAEPTRGLLAKGVFRFMHLFEPASMSDWARGGFELELRQAGLHRVHRVELARGTARAVLARP
jgi:ubiquinone/menaquinone biosynthesis C-methylase UbiE